jgi:soluble lytic murein transglycosylase
LALLRADDPEADQAFQELLLTYPGIPDRTTLLFERAQSLLRQRRHDEAAAVIHEIRVDHPGSRIAPWAETELRRLQTLGYRTPAMSDEERVRRAKHLERTGPLDKARAAVAELLESPLSPRQRAEVHYLAGRLAAYEGRWKDAERHLHAAQSLAVDDPEMARHLQNRAKHLEETASARDRDRAHRRLTEMRAGQSNAVIPSTRLVDMIRVAAAAELTAEINDLLGTLSRRTAAPAAVLFDAAMAAVGTGREELIIALLERLAKRADSGYRTAATYHLARARERAGALADASLFFAQAKATAESAGDRYYALWAENGLGRVGRGERSSGREGLVDSEGQMVAHFPRASDEVLADQLQPIAELHEDSYPWIGRAVDLLRVGERDAATAELFEAYLEWRHALGRPIARAGLDCVARADGRIQQPIPSTVRAARLGLSNEDRATLAAVAAALGDMGTAGGFAGPSFIDALPRAYEWLVVPAANRHGVDPNLLLAVMRVESAYQRHIVSYAGAVGLMQIMPRTGQLIAHALGHDDFTLASLLEPGLNVEFAAWYLGSLIHRFDGRLPLAIAAYNGGPHNVRRWMQESPKETPVDVLLERIPFAQTYNYVRKVLVHYEAYRKQEELPMLPLSVQLPDQRIDPLAF